MFSRYPMLMSPVYKDYLWGGDMFQKVFSKNSGYAITAESWELSTYEGSETIIKNGAYQGTPFGQYIKAHREAIGTHLPSDASFPVLIKFLDVNTALSVQVHPSDETARADLFERGKAEVWHIVAAKPGGFLYYGLNTPLTRAQFLSHIRKGTVCDVLNKVYVKPGQTWFITPGVLHSAGDGVLVAEVQQSSNTTFRVYDFDRVDANGNKRELHLDRALDVMEYAPIEQSMEKNLSFYTPDFAYSDLFACDYFLLSRIVVKRQMQLTAGEETFHALLILSGEGTLHFAGITYPLRAGDSCFIPAGMGNYQLEGQLTCLMTRI